MIQKTEGSNFREGCYNFCRGASRDVTGLPDATNHGPETIKLKDELSAFYNRNIDHTRFQTNRCGGYQSKDILGAQSAQERFSAV